MEAFKIGEDEWAAQAAACQDRRTARAAALLAQIEQAPPLLLAALLLAVGALLPLAGGNDYLLRVAATACLYMILALGLNLVAGMAGLLDLGYVAFFGIGAYTYAVLASPQLGLQLPAWQALPLAVAAAAACGTLLGLPALRLRGDHLAVITLGFAQVTLLLALRLDRLELPWSTERINLTGGPNGILNVAPLGLFGWQAQSQAAGYLVMLAALIVMLIFVAHLDRSRLGRAWRAMREDSLAAAALGMPVRSLKILAVTVGATIAGVAGSLFSAWQGAIFPTNLDLSLLLTLYAAVLLGGLGSLPGVILGALLLAVLPELLRDPTAARLLGYGGITLALLWRRPRRRGLFGLAGATLLAAFLLAATSALDLDRTLTGNLAFLAGAALLAAAARPWSFARAWLLIPALGLLGAVWELRLVSEPAITRMLLLGALLVALMMYRPHGLLGRPRID